jgi:hypothetical protein
MTVAHWFMSVSADFNTAADWNTGKVPGYGDDAVLSASGTTPYTVTASTSHLVDNLRINAEGTLAITGGVFNVLDGTGIGALAGLVTVGDKTGFKVGGTVVNSGAIALDSAAHAADLIVAAGGLTLSGAGQVNLGGSGLGRVYGSAAAAVLVNVDDTIAGAGQVGHGTLAFTNQAAGVIEAAGGKLTVFTGTNTLINDGRIESSATGVLLLGASTIDDSGGGTIAAAGGQVLLQGVHIEGGALDATGATVFAAKGFDSVLDGAAQAIGLTGTLKIDPGATLTVEGSLSGAGEIDLEGGAAAAELIVGAVGFTLASGQTLNSRVATSIIEGVSSKATLTNDGTILGGGQLGAGQMQLVNDAAGVINNSSANPLIINTGGTLIQNTGVIKATGSGGIVIESPVVSGKLEAIHGNLTLTNNVSDTTGVIDAATLRCEFNTPQTVTFSGTTGILDIAGGDVQKVTGFSSSGGTEIDIRDIPFDGSAHATFTPAFAHPTESGKLVVSNGLTSSTFGLIGNFTSSEFNVSSDGHGGTIVECALSGQSATSPAASSVRSPGSLPLSLNAAAAAFGATAAELSHGAAADRVTLTINIVRP